MAQSVLKKKYPCLLCDSETVAQKRAHLKSSDSEPLLSLKSLLLSKSYSEEQVSRCLELPVIVCKGSCQSTLRRYSKMKEEMTVLETELSEKMSVKMMLIVEQHAANTPTNSPTRLGREALATPVKDILSRTVAMETPTSFVSVACSCTLNRFLL